MGGVLGLALLLGGAPVAAGSGETFELRRGAAAFWDGKGEAATYDLNVAERGFRLRVGIDHFRVGDVWQLELRDPSGQVERTVTPGTGLYSAEAVVEDPVPGRWTAAVTGEGVKDPRYRMRALLEASPPAPGPREALLPNLQAMPPWDFTFMYPVTNGGGIPPVESTGVSIAGRASCHPEEVAEQGAVRCLRMAFGVRNTGQGPMQLHYASAAGYEDRELLQRVVYSDGTTEDRVAGFAVFHHTHQHYHHDQAVSLQLFRVVGEGELEPASAEQRKGFAHRDELLREWRRFYPLHEDFGFGLASGWGDYYEWDRPGNYIEFGLNPDGRYLLRLTADPVQGVLESNEFDNVGYSVFDVAGEKITWIASGRGNDPWDRCNIPLGNGPEPDPVAPLRPVDCPPDTTWLPEAPASGAPKGKAKPSKKAKRKKAGKRKKVSCKTRKQKRSKRCKARRRKG